MVVTGATKLLSFQALYDETGKETLEVRRKKQKIILFYKMCNGFQHLIFLLLYHKQ